MIYSVYWSGISGPTQIVAHHPIAPEARASYAAAGPQYSPNLRLTESGVPRKNYSTEQIFGEAIKEGEDNTFVVILTPDLEPGFRLWVKKYGMERNILFEMPNYIKNGNYWTSAPRLKLILLGSNHHAMYDMFIVDEETEEVNEDTIGL